MTTSKNRAENPASDSKPYLDIYALKKVYETSRGPSVILEGFNLSIQKGEIVALIGHSGCGKSTVLTMVAGLNEVTAGSIIMDGKEVYQPGPDRGVVFQSPCLLPWMTAFENVMLGVEQVFFHVSKTKRKQIAEHFLYRVGLKDAKHKYPGELSQGMCQRVGLARAFALQPKLILLDEPFGMLDQLTKLQLQDVLLEILDYDRTTAVIVTHDVDEAIYIADKVVMMTNGPAARVGAILDINFQRPRDRKTIMNQPEYFEYRNILLEFLENCELEKDRINKKGVDDKPLINSPSSANSECNHASVEEEKVLSACRSDK